MIRRVLLFIGLFALAIFIYRNGLHIPYYNDDYQRVFTNPKEAVFEGFLTANPYDGFYRPIEQLVLAAIQVIWGWDTFPVRLVHLIVQAAIALLAFHILRTWKISTGCAVAASIFVIVSQLSVYAVASNNSLSQMLATLFSALSLWLAYRYFSRGDNMHRRWKYILSVAFFFAALLSKETSMGLLLGIPLLLVLLQERRRNFSIRIKEIAGQCIPYGLCFIVYFLLRKNAGALFPVFSGPATIYTFQLGSNIIHNIGLFAIQMVLPVSTVSVMRDVYFHEYASLILIGMFTSIFTLLVAYGVWKSAKRSIALFLCVLIVFSWFPAILLPHVMELYIYNMIVYIALLIGVSAEYYYMSFSKRSQPILAVLSSFFLLVLITNAWGVNEKTSLMKNEADRAEIFLRQLISLTRTVPVNTTLYLMNPPSGFTYSKFASSLFAVSEHSDDLLRFYANRSDVRFFIGDSASCAVHSREHAGVVLACDVNTLRIYPIGTNGDGKFRSNDFKTIR